jgi:hypothetical protein
VDNSKKPLPPAHLLLLDAVGCVFLGVGFAKQFGHIDLIPTALRFEGYGVSFIVGGALFMVPALVHMIKSALERGRDGARKL